MSTAVAVLLMNRVNNEEEKYMPAGRQYHRNAMSLVSIFFRHEIRSRYWDAVVMKESLVKRLPARLPAAAHNQEYIIRAEII